MAFYTSIYTEEPKTDARSSVIYIYTQLFGPIAARANHFMNIA